MIGNAIRSAAAALIVLLGVIACPREAEAQIYCPQSTFGTYGVTPTAGQWWVCLNFLQSSVQSTNPLTALPTGDIFIGNLSGRPAAQAVGGDATLSALGALTVTKTNGVPFTAAATTPLGTSGASLCLLSANCTFSGTDNFTGTFEIGGVAVALPISAANGGSGEAGTVTGALKGNGTSAYTQAACADLSNGGTACPANTGTSGATIPLNNGNNTSSGNQTHSGTENFTGPIEIGGTAVTLPVPVAIGGTGAATVSGALANLGLGLTDDSGMSTSASDNTSALNSSITSVYNSAIGAGTYLGSPVVHIAGGIYEFTGSTGITSRPAIKLFALGDVELDFSGASSTVTGLRVHNQDAPAGSGTNRNPANKGPFFSPAPGSMFLNGPGRSTSSIGMDLGNSVTSGSQDNQFRDSLARDFRANNWGTGVFFEPDNTYLSGLEDFNIEFCTSGIRTATGTNSNSGEKMWFTSGAISGCTNGYYNNIDGFDASFDNVSIDFMTGAAAYFGTQSRYSKQEFINDHFEHNDGGIIQSAATTNTLHNLDVTVRDSKVVTTTTTGNFANQQLFTGRFSLDLDGLQVGGYGSPSLAADGMFMIDRLTTVKRLKDVTFTGYSQMMSANVMQNNDPFFAYSTGGAAGSGGANGQDASTLIAWKVTSSSGITATIDNGTVWTTFGGLQSIKYTCTNGTGNFYVLLSDKFRVNPGDRFISSVAFNGGVSTGSDSVQLRMYFTDDDSSVTTANDGGAFGDSLNTDYNTVTDPAYAGGARNFWGKLFNNRQSQVPAGYHYAQLEMTVSSMALSDVIWVGFAGVNPL